MTGKLLSHLGIKQRLVRYDDHADARSRDFLLELMQSEPVALVSDAGTPLISDPGYRLVKAAREAGIAVTSMPGPCAAIVGLTLSGLPSDRFLFGGFLPVKDKARRDVLEELGGVNATLIFYETAPRIVRALESIGQSLPGREIAVGRELTKKFEECRTGSAEELATHFNEHPPKGEIVVMIAPPVEGEGSEIVADALLKAELATSKPSQAAAKVAKATGLDRKMLYARAMELK